jgi:hypothetical protein
MATTTKTTTTRDLLVTETDLRPNSRWSYAEGVDRVGHLFEFMVETACLVQITEAIRRDGGAIAVVADWQLIPGYGELAATEAR